MDLMVQAIKIDKSEILSELARSMGIPETQISQRNVLAELIRFAFCSLSSNQERTEAIFVRRLLDYVRARFQFLGENINYEDLIGESIVKSLNVAIRSTMDDLDRTGDISELSGGYWMPLPSRYIHHGETVLVLSSLPTIQITQQSGCKLNAETLVRTTDTT